MELGELNIHIGDGNYSSKYPKNSEFLEEGVPFISASDFQGRVFIADGMKHISEELHSVLLKGHLKPRDILVVVRGNGCGKVGFVPAEYDNANINAQLALLRCDNQTVNSEYLYYLLSTNEYQNKLKALCSGSAQPQLPIKSLKKLQLELPKYEMQLKIAGVAKIIDDKMLNNAAINRNLLEQAIAVFKEKIWTKDKNGTIGDYCIMKSGFSFKSSWWTNDGVKVIKIGDINQDNLSLATCSHVDEDKVEKAGDFSVKAGDLVLAMTGATIGKFAMVPERSETILVNQRVGKFFLGEEPLKRVPFIYCTLKMDDVYSEVIGRGQGSAQPNISGNDVMTIPCVIPTDMEIDAFNEFAEPIFASIVKNQNENEKLANLRDSLLPKLMSGELDVSDLDI